MAAIDPERFPHDAAAYLVFQEHLREITSRHPLPPPMPVAELETALEELSDRHDVRWERS